MKHVSNVLICVCTVLSSCMKVTETPPDVDFSHSICGSWHYYQRQKYEYFYSEYQVYEITSTDYGANDMLWLHTDSTYLKIVAGDTSIGRWSIIQDGLYYMIMTEKDTTYRHYIPILNSETLQLKEEQKPLEGLYVQVLKRVL